MNEGTSWRAWPAGSRRECWAMAKPGNGVKASERGQPSKTKKAHAYEKCASPRMTRGMKLRSVLGRRHHRLQLLDHARLHKDASLLVCDRHVEHLSEQDRKSVV